MDSSAVSNPSRKRSLAKVTSSVVKHNLNDDRYPINKLFQPFQDHWLVPSLSSLQKTFDTNLIQSKGLHLFFSLRKMLFRFPALHSICMTHLVHCVHPSNWSGFWNNKPNKRLDRISYLANYRFAFDTFSLWRSLKIALLHYVSNKPV